MPLQEIYSCLQWFHKNKKDMCKKETTTKDWHNRTFQWASKILSYSHLLMQK